MLILNEIFFYLLLGPSEKNVPLDGDVYDALFSILSGTRTFTDWPKNSEENLRQRVYRKWKANLYEVKEIHDPVAACLIKRIIYRPSNCMVARKSEITQIVDRAYQETKGEGARKLKVHTSHYYSGLSRNAIHKN